MAISRELQHIVDVPYKTQAEVLYQIYCLNKLRKETKWDYDYDSTLGDVHKAHNVHCVDIHYQTLECSADVGVITHNWVHNDKILEPR
jgi:hypothetical protein